VNRPYSEVKRKACGRTAGCCGELELTTPERRQKKE